MALKHKGILRLGYARLGLNDSRLLISRAFYRENIGMLESLVEPHRVYLRCWHESFQHSLVLEEAEHNHLMEIGFQVRDQDDLVQFTQKLEDLGIKVDQHAKDEPLRGLGKSISFPIPGGPLMRLYVDMHQTGYVTGYEAPDWVVPKELRGTQAPYFLNHIGLTVPDPAATVDFLTEILGFVVSEKIVKDDSGETLSALLFRMSKDVGGQELAIFPGAAGKLHHIAFTKEDANDILVSGLYLRQDGVEIDIYGPTRQSYGKTFSLHFFDPLGIRLELCSGGRLTEVHPEFQPVIWHESQIKKAFSYYDKDFNEDFLRPTL